MAFPFDDSADSSDTPPPAAPTPAPVATSAPPAAPPLISRKASAGSYRDLPMGTADDLVAADNYHAAQAAAASAPATPAAPSILDMIRATTRQAPSVVVTNPPPAPPAFPNTPPPSQPMAAAPSSAAGSGGSVLLPIDESDTDDEPTAKVPAAAPAASTGNPPAPAPAPAASTLTAGDDDSDGEAGNQQALRDQAATNKYARSQGAQMTVTPTGQTTQAVDEFGNPLLKAKVIANAQQGDDGKFYRVSQDQYGNQHSFDLLQGAEGNDYKTDPQTGEQYVPGDGLDGSSKRTVIGQDPWIPARNQISQAAAGHRATVEDAQNTIDSAQAGTAGAPGLGGYSLKSLQNLAGMANRNAAPLQNKLAAYKSFLDANPNATLSMDQVGEIDDAQAQLAKLTPQTQSLADEINARQSTIDNARQAHVAATQNEQAARNVSALIGTGSSAQRQAIVDDLSTAASGGNLSDKRASRLQAAGLLDQNGNVSNVGASLLPPPPAQPAAPGGMASMRSFMVSKNANGNVVDQYETTPTPVDGENPQQFWQRQQQAVVREFPDAAQAGSPANRTFLRAFQMAGSDPRKTLLVARAVLGK